MSTTPVTVEAIPPGNVAGIAEYIRIRCAVTPDEPDSIDNVHWEDATYPGEVTRFVARIDGLAVGAATTGRIWMNRLDYPRYWVGAWVLPEARRRGVGSQLYRAVSAVARDAGKTGFQTWLSEVHTSGVEFLTHRGFTIERRDKLVRLHLRDRNPPMLETPAGIRLTTLADRPDLVPGVHATAIEAFPDIPTTDEPIEVGTLDAFVARDVDRVGVPQDGFMIAVDEASGDVAGYASLIFVPGSSTVAYHDMTAVRPAYRGRGIAKALKRATIAWAIRQGLEALETGNDEQNAPMRAVNLALGYQPIPDALSLQGPLAPET